MKKYKCVIIDHKDDKYYYRKLDNDNVYYFTLDDVNECDRDHVKVDSYFYLVVDDDNNVDYQMIYSYYMIRRRTIHWLKIKYKIMYIISKIFRRR